MFILQLSTVKNMHLISLFLIGPNAIVMHPRDSDPNKRLQQNFGGAIVFQRNSAYAFPELRKQMLVEKQQTLTRNLGINLSEDLIASGRLSLINFPVFTVPKFLSSLLSSTHKENLHSSNFPLIQGPPETSNSTGKSHSSLDQVSLKYEAIWGHIPCLSLGDFVPL